MDKIIIYKNVPCPIVEFKEPDSFLVLYKGEQKWIYESSLGYGEIKIDINNNPYYLYNNKVHRDKGPAYMRELFNETVKIWCKEGIQHRLDGPAIERYTSSESSGEYWIDGLKYSQKEYWKEIREIKNEKISINTKNN